MLDLFQIIEIHLSSVNSVQNIHDKMHFRKFIDSTSLQSVHIGCAFSCFVVILTRLDDLLRMGKFELELYDMSYL